MKKAFVLSTFRKDRNGEETADKEPFGVVYARSEREAVKKLGIPVRSFSLLKHEGGMELRVTTQEIMRLKGF